MGYSGAADSTFCATASEPVFFGFEGVLPIQTCGFRSDPPLNEFADPSGGLSQTLLFEWTVFLAERPYAISILLHPDRDPAKGRPNGDGLRVGNTVTIAYHLARAMSVQHGLQGNYNPSTSAQLRILPALL